MDYLTPIYDLRVVGASILIASFASYVALDLVKRVRTNDHAVARSWWLGGSVAMGTGIWAMHFLGMLAFSLPITLGYTYALTVASWVAAVAVSGVALSVASQCTLTLRCFAFGALAMGAGICAMHYIGMAALDMAPGIVWRWDLVAASATIAVVASAAALLLFFWQQRVSDRSGPVYQMGAAIVMGLAISGMHYTGMAAARFPAGTVCLSANALGGSTLGSLIVLASVTMLALTLFMSILDARMRNKTARLTEVLQVANVQLQSANKALQQHACVDTLTGLARRSSFEDRLARVAAKRINPGDTHRGQQRLSVVSVDLDGFRAINESLGHSSGDSVLKEAASRLRGAAHVHDLVARVGGDTFLVLMEDVSSVADCETRACQIIEALALPFDVAGRRVELSCSVGISVYPDHGQLGELVAYADAAMRVAKRSGGGTYAVFEPKMNVRSLKQLDLQNDLRHAVERGQLTLHYQPKIDARHGQIQGVEALLRWRHPQQGMVSPAVFIPIAERSGLIYGLGNWVIDEACRQMRAWAEAGMRMRVAINISVHQLRRGDLVARIEQALERHQVEASQLLCEITESAVMDDVSGTLRTFEGMERIGVHLSIDDFGTGYSSLSYLRQLSAKQLKIDRSFVNDLESSSDARAIVDAVIHMAHALSLRVVAEGVETPGQRNVLVQLGCDELQGFYFAKPMPADTLMAWAGVKRPQGTAEYSPSITHEMVALAGVEHEVQAG